VVTPRTIKGAPIYNEANNLVPCDPTTIYAAMMDHKDDITSALHTPDATFKLKKFASDPKNPVLFINLAAPDDEEVEEGTVSAGTLIPLQFLKFSAN
jgi:hypothetical protein